jgi:diguanylate cyclase (GGDEF)-like protein
MTPHFGALHHVMDTTRVATGIRPATRAERVLLAGIALAVLVHILSTFARAPGAYLAWADFGLYCGAFSGAALMCLLRGRREPEQRGAWFLVALALTLWVVGSAWHGVVRLGGAAPGYPDAGDWICLLAYPTGAVALVQLLRGLVPSFLSIMWLDGLIAALGMAAIAYPLAFDHVITLSDGSVEKTVVGLAYPVGVLTLLVVIGAIAGMVQRFASPMWLLLTAGLLASQIGSTIYVVRSAAGDFVAGTPTDAWWSLAAVLFAAGAFTPPPTEKPQLRDGPWWAVVLLPGAFAAASVALLVYGQRGDLATPAVALALGSIVATGLRTLITYRDASRLAETRRLARTDDLTGLPNRRGFNHTLQTLMRHRSTDRPVAVLLMDLDRFKEVNDALGHDIGDDLLRLVGPRVSACLRPNDLLARLGGDEFAIVLTERADVDGARLVAERIVRALGKPFQLPEIALHVGASIGIAVFPDHAQGAHALLRQADVAMYDAKGLGVDYQVYDPCRDSLSRDRLETIEQLRSAIHRKELVLHYQPKVELATGTVPGVEALVRWQHPVRGLLTPDRFLPLAEHTGLMRMLTAHVLEEALTQLRRWRDSGWPLGVAVNVSTSNLLDAELPGQVGALLDQHGIAPQLLTLEVTESTIMADPVRAKQVVQALHEQGVKVSVDDYGTGYSSLAYLRHLAVRELKLDRDFVRDVCRDARASAIVRSTVDLAHSLGLQMVAEGVEDDESARLLADLGCDVAQGYHYSRPLPAGGLQEWLARRSGQGDPDRRARVGG